MPQEKFIEELTVTFNRMRSAHAREPLARGEDLESRLERLYRTESNGCKFISHPDQKPVLPLLQKAYWWQSIHNRKPRSRAIADLFLDWVTDHGKPYESTEYLRQKNSGR